MKITETELRKPFVAVLRKAGALVVPYTGSIMGQNGTADAFLASIPWSGWVEFKGPTTKLEPLQEYFLGQMKARNVNAIMIRLYPGRQFLVDDVTEIYEWNNGHDILERLVSYANNFVR